MGITKEVTGSIGAERSTLTVLCAAVAAFYKAEGDKTRAGVSVACLEHDPDHFYASVVRYPGGPYGHKIVVVNTHHKTDDKFTTVEEAVDELAVRWFRMVKPAPVESTLDALANVLARRQ